MKILPLSQEFLGKISILMFKDIFQHSYPSFLINKYEEFAREFNLIKELSNPDILAFVSVYNKEVLGFIFGYKELSRTAVIYYLTGNQDSKILLLEKFIKEAKKDFPVSIKIDSFQFMANKNLLTEFGFKLKRGSEFANVESLFYELSLSYSKH